MSLPTRECGLKPIRDRHYKRDRVTPHAGVWIETRSLNAQQVVRLRHSPRGSVD